MDGDASRVASATGIQKICGGMMIAGQKMPRDLSVLKYIFSCIDEYFFTIHILIICVW
jgi:hypothetical protein